MSKNSVRIPQSLLQSPQRETKQPFPFPISNQEMQSINYKNWCKIVAISSPEHCICKILFFIILLSSHFHQNHIPNALHLIHVQCRNYTLEKGIDKKTPLCSCVLKITRSCNFNVPPPPKKNKENQHALWH